MRSKLQEQRKWEEQNLRQDQSFDVGASLPRSILLQTAASTNFRRPSFDVSVHAPYPSQPELPSDEL